MSDAKQLRRANPNQAQRLDALGFDWERVSEWGKLNGGGWLLMEGSHMSNKTSFERYYFAPTVALALKWVRDVKKIIYRIEVTAFNKFYAEILKDSAKCTKDGYNLNDWKSVKIKGSSAVSKFSTYEEAESALLDAVLGELEKISKG